MNETNSEWCRVRDRLQKLANLLYWQWEMRLAAWRLGNICLDFTAEQCGDRTTQYIRYLRQVMCWLPYTIENRTTVVCLALGIRCLPVRRSRGPAPAIPDEPEVEWVPCGGRFYEG